MGNFNSCYLYWVFHCSVVVNLEIIGSYAKTFRNCVAILL